MTGEQLEEFMKASKELADLIAEEDADLLRKAVECIKPLYDLKKAKADYDRGIRMFDPSASDYGKMGPLRRWLLDHEGERLIEQETDPPIAAWLEFAGHEYVYEPPQVIAAADAPLFARLVELGCLSIDHKAVQEATTKGLLAVGHIDQYRRVRERTHRLRIEEVKK